MSPRRRDGSNWCASHSIAQFALLGILVYIAWTIFYPYAPIQPINSLLGDAPVRSGHRAPCQGPRGKNIRNNKDDQIEEVVFKSMSDNLLVGSYEALSLKRTWSSADGRYGPYGRGEDRPGYKRSKVKWSNIDWGTLQSQCAHRNQARFGAPVQPLTSRRRMSYPSGSSPRQFRPRPARTTGRTALVLRGWEEFVFHDPNHWNIRSIISEAALQLDGDYSVFILVDIHDKEARIFDSKRNYDAKLKQVAPPEYRNMTVLFDESLLEAWYPKIGNHGMRYQLLEPIQLFAHFFDDYDFYWQLEMDMRFTGHTGKTLESLSTFARNEPRKQARERASYMFTPKTYGSYQNFTAQVNKSINGGSAFWKGIRIPDIEPIGPSPSVSRPEDDDFEYGVGEDADSIILGPCSNITLLQELRGEEFRFTTYIEGSRLGKQTPRVICPPAMGRASWNLLNAIHNLQVEKGLQVPSELTLPSFALWLNLKISKVPHPIYVDREVSTEFYDKYANGEPPLAKYHGMARASRNHRAFQNSVERPQISFRAHSSYAKHAFFAWFDHTPDTLKEEKPLMLHVHNGKFYAPNCIIHPAKYNSPKKAEKGFEKPPEQKPKG